MIFIDTVAKEIGNRDLTLPIKRLIHVAGVAETTTAGNDFARKFVDLLEEDGSLSSTTGSSNRKDIF